MRPWVAIGALLLSGCYDSSFGERHEETTPPPATTTIGELRARFEGTTVAVESETTVCGRVTTSDRSGNFYRTLCIESDGAGLEIMAGLDHLHNDYPEGCLLTVRLQGWALGESRGVLQAGRLPSASDGYPTDYIASRPAVARTIIRHDTPPQPSAPTVRTIGELTPALCGTLVRIERVRYAPDGLAEGTWAGNKRFTDQEGAAVYTYVRPYADFAGNEVPAGPCSLTGILQHDGGRYLLKLRDETDCSPL